MFPRKKKNKVKKMKEEEKKEKEKKKRIRKKLKKIAGQRSCWPIKTNMVLNVPD